MLETFKTRPSTTRAAGSRVVDLAILLMLVAGTVALAGTFDVIALLASWSARPWGWLLNQAWALLVILMLVTGLVALRRGRQFRAEVQRREAAERRLAEHTAASSEWQWEIDAEQRLVKVSEQAPSVLVDLARARVPWRPGGPLLEDEAWVRHRADLLRRRPIRDFRFRLVAADGSERHLQINGFPVRDGEGTLLGFRGTGTDVTGTALAQAKAQHMASHDALTDLTNRPGLIAGIEQALVRARAGGEQAALLCIDLDRFSELNDTLGHAVGDRLLKSCAERLLACVEPGDTLARIGGDEFAMVQQRADQPAAAEAVCRRLSRGPGGAVRDRGREPDPHRQHRRRADPGRWRDRRRAAQARRHRAASGQGAGRGSCCFFEPDDGRRAVAPQGVEAELWRALAAAASSRSTISRRSRARPAR